MKRSLASLALCTAVLCGLSVQSPAAAFTYFLKSVPVFHLEINSSTGWDHLTDWVMTTSTDEANAAVAGGWIPKGIFCYVSPARIPGTIPLYRLYGVATTDHFYTTSVSERNDLIARGYIPEGTVGYVYPAGSHAPGTVPLYQWTVSPPYVPPGDIYRACTLKPSSESDTPICDVWTAERELVSLTVTAPRRDEELKGGDTYDISWNSTTRGGYVYLNYSTDAGTTWRLLESGIENKGFFTWKVPNVETLHARVQIVWTDFLFDESHVLAQTESEFDFRIRRTQMSAGAQAAIPVQARLPAPARLTAAAASASEVRLGWGASPGRVKGYLVERRIGNGPFRQVANVPAPRLAYVDRSVSPGTGYAYRVCAYALDAPVNCSAAAPARTALALKPAFRPAVRRK
jgi:hypothetical protein